MNNQQLAMNRQQPSEGNTLWPVFFRLDKLRVLIVGAGEVGMEKLTFMLKSSPTVFHTAKIKDK